MTGQQEARRGEMGLVSMSEASYMLRCLLTSQEERVDVLSVIGAGHELLAETNGVLSLRGSVEVFELILGDAPLGEVDLHCLDSDILGSRRGSHGW